MVDLLLGHGDFLLITAGAETRLQAPLITGLQYGQIPRAADPRPLAGRRAAAGGALGRPPARSPRLAGAGVGRGGLPWPLEQASSDGISVGAVGRARRHR